MTYKEFINYESLGVRTNSYFVNQIMTFIYSYLGNRNCNMSYLAPFVNRSGDM